MKKMFVGICFLCLIGSNAFAGGEKYKSEMASMAFQISKYVKAWKNHDLTNSNVGEIIYKLDEIKSHIASSTPSDDDSGKFIKRQERLLYWIPKLQTAMRSGQAIDGIVHNYKDDTQ